VGRVRQVLVGRGVAEEAGARLGVGHSDCTIVAMEPLLAAGGAFAIELRRHVGEPDGREPSIDLQLVCRPDLTPGIRGLWGTAVVEAFNEPPAFWIAGQLRHEPQLRRDSRTTDLSRRCCGSTARVAVVEGSSVPPNLRDGLRRVGSRPCRDPGPRERTASSTWDARIGHSP
jgi:hypothetical protein